MAIINVRTIPTKKKSINIEFKNESNHEVSQKFTLRILLEVRVKFYFKMRINQHQQTKHVNFIFRQISY